jgi:ketose-bisphosphate aldolase
MPPVRPNNVYPLKTLLAAAEAGQYCVGAFSPRYTAMIGVVLRAGQALQSPLIVQISQKELARHEITPARFGETFYSEIARQGITVPVALHLDHTKDMSVIQQAIDAGFTSVMIDASEKPLEENIAISREVAQYAHPFDVSVEAELGRITTTDYVESDDDTEMYTDPDEGAYFVNQTGVDALAVSCGTAHGVYLVRQPKIDYERLSAIRQRTPVHLVLHGGSGVPAEMVHNAIGLPGGGVSKMNIATDLEMAALAALGRDRFLTDAEMNALPTDQLEKAQAAVYDVVCDKMKNFVRSAGQAAQ